MIAFLPDNQHDQSTAAFNLQPQIQPPTPQSFFSSILMSAWDHKAPSYSYDANAQGHGLTHEKLGLALGKLFFCP